MGLENVNEKQIKNISIAKKLIYFLSLSTSNIYESDTGGVNYEFHFRYFNQVEHLRVVIHFTTEGSVFVIIGDIFNDYNRMIEIDSGCLEKIRKTFYKRLREVIK